MSPERLGRVLAVGFVLLLAAGLILGAWWVPQRHTDRVDADQALAAVEGLPTAPEPTFPGGLNGQAVGARVDQNRDLRVQIWTEVAKSVRAGESGDTKHVARDLQRKLRRRGARIGHKPGEDGP